MVKSRTTRPVATQPDLKLLATFLAVVRAGSMAEAATALGYVPSAVSQHVAALERDLGVTLLLRRPGSRLVLTGAGRSLARAAETLFDATARFQDVAHAVAAHEIAELRVGTYPSATTYLLPTILPTLRAGHTADIRLVDVETAEGLPRLRSGDLDLLVAYRYLPDDPPTRSPSWTITSLGHEPLILVAGSEPGLGQPLRLEDCVERTWISGHAHNPDRRLLQRWTGELGVVPRVALETDDLHSMLAMVRASRGVALIPATLLTVEAAWHGIERVTLPPDAPSLHREILAVSRPGARPAVVDDLVTLLRDAVESVGAPATPTIGP